MADKTALRLATSSAGLLGIFALATALALGLTFALTEENIADARRQVEERALVEVIQGVPHNNDILADTLEVPTAGRAVLNSDEQLIHVARQDGEPVAFIFPSVAPDGYSGEISMLIGIEVDGTISGVRVTRHAETPGLGDKIDLNKSDWVLGFNGLSPTSLPDAAWAVRKDGGHFDAFTGATITPRAVVGQIKRTLDYYAAHREQFIDTSGAETP